VSNGRPDLSKKEAVPFALGYAETNGLGELLEVHDTFYHNALSKQQRLNMEARLGRPMKAKELEFLKTHDLSALS
jgi:hypothetical protein